MIEDATYTNLRAQVAMRQEDLRIARKHEQEAAARPATAPNRAAYEGAVRWMESRAAALRRAQEMLFDSPEHPVYGGARA